MSKQYDRSHSYPSSRDAPTDILAQAHTHIATFFEDLLNTLPHQCSFHSWLKSRNRLQEADRIITALVYVKALEWSTAEFTYSSRHIVRTIGLLRAGLFSWSNGTCT